MTTPSDGPPKPRTWTPAELQRLFSDYFDGKAGACPVCGGQVRMRMESADDTVTLKMRCPICRNSAQVTQKKPH